MRYRAMSYTDFRLLVGAAVLAMLGIGWLYAHGFKLLAVAAFLGCGIVAAVLIRWGNNNDDD